jgi:anti-sigma regulatory factor (Ser/Thr protein kinase)
VAAARRFARDATEDLGGDAHVAQLLVSELATNVVTHARTAFSVVIDPVGDCIRIAVRDSSSDLPRLRFTVVDADTGRGLKVIEGLASAWGVESSGGHKTVWVEFPRSE